MINKTLAGKLQLAENLINAGILTTPEQYFKILDMTSPTDIKDLDGIFKAAYSTKLQSLLNNAVQDAIVSGEPQSVDLTKLENQCYCDLATIIMVTGCICGGK